MTTSLYQPDECRAVKEARLTRLTLEFHLTLKHHRHKLGKVEPSEETVAALETCGFVVYSLTYANLEEPLTIWYAMEQGQRRKAELLAAERKIIADELQAPTLYAGLAEDIATGSKRIVDPDVQGAGDRLHQHAQDVMRDLSTRHPEVRGLVPQKPGQQTVVRTGTTG